MATSWLVVATLIVTQTADPASEEQVTEVHVRGEKADTLRRTSGSRTVISEEDIAHAKPQSSGEMLQRVPGLQVRQEDQTGFRLNLGVRGLSPVRSRLILLEEDGIPVVVSPYGEPELYYTTAIERVQRVTVLKGSDVLMHGPQTVGAVIQLQTWEPTETPTWYAAATGGTQAFGEVLGRYSDTVNDTGYLVQAMHKWGDGVRDMGFHATDAFIKARLNPNAHGELRLKVGFHDELANTTYTGLTQHMFEANPRQATAAPYDHFGIRRSEIGLAYDHHVSDDTVVKVSFFAYEMTLGLRLQDFDRSVRPQDDPTQGGATVAYQRIPDPQALFFRNTTSLRNRVYDVVGLQAAVQSRFATGAIHHKTTAGVRAVGDFARLKLSQGAFPTADSGALLTDEGSRILGLAGWVEDQVALGDYVLVTPAFRVEHAHSAKTTYRMQNPGEAPTDVHATGTSDATGLMPGVGVIVGTAKLSGFTSAYRGYSAPRVAQSITPDGHDAHLSAEHSSNFELGMRGKTSWLRAEADAFYIAFENQLVSNNPLSGNTSELVNGGHTRHKGFEATATASLGKALALPLTVELSAQYTFVDSRFKGGDFNGNRVPYSPANTFTTTLDVAHAIGLSAQVALAYIGPQYSDEANTVVAGPTGLDGRINPYTTLNATLGYKHAPTGLSLSVAAKNLLDKVYISDRLPNGIFTAGFRQVFVTLAWATPD